jgi:hypothetical protein
MALCRQEKRREERREEGREEAREARPRRRYRRQFIGYQCRQQASSEQSQNVLNSTEKRTLADDR